MFRPTVVFLALIVCCALHAQNLLDNAGFEGEFGDDGLPSGWADNSSWADLDVTYAREATNPHSGEACLKVTCARLDYGAVQVIPTAVTPLKKGTIYRMRAWLRGDVGNVALQLRLAPPPYTVYIEQGPTVTGDWEQLEYFWTSTVDDPNGRFMIRFAQTGTLWIDDLSIEELTPEQATSLLPPPRPGNLIHNGRFDFGQANWLLALGADHWQGTTMRVESETDNQCLALEIPDGEWMTLSSDVAQLAAGHEARLTCRLKADRPTNVTVSGAGIYRNVAVTEDWQELAASAKVGFSPDPHGYIRFSAYGPVKLWLDDVQLRQDADSPREIIDAAVISGRHPMALYHVGEQVGLTVHVSAPANHEPANLIWSVEDFEGNVELEGSREFGPGLHRVELAAGGVGWHRARVKWQEGDWERINECTFCVLPPAERTGDIASSPFGAHYAVDPVSLALAKAVGVRWLRLHPPNHTKWRVVEPEQGEWAWRDEAIKIAKDAGLELIGSLDRCPDWASSAPEGTPKGGFYTGIGAWLPRDWAEWENYVSQTVRHHKADIHIWEVWNEANLTDWLIPREGQTRAEAYVEMLKHTYPIVKREDPAAIVIGGCIAGAMRETSPAWQFAQDIIDLGALEYMDVFSYHDYIGRPVDEGSDPIETWMERLRERMRAAGKLVPIINSEGGFANPGTSITYRPSSPGRVGPTEMAKWMVRQYVSQMAVGVEQFFFYNFFIDGWPIAKDWEGFVEGDGQPLPNVAAYATMTWLLDGPKFRATVRPSDDVWLHEFDTTRGTMAVAWARTDKRASLDVGRPLRIWNLMGRELPVPPDGTLQLTDSPVYILTGD